MLARCSLNYDVQFGKFKNVIFDPPGVQYEKSAQNIIHVPCALNVFWHQDTMLMEVHGYFCVIQRSYQSHSCYVNLEHLWDKNGAYHIVCAPHAIKTYQHQDIMLIELCE